jgi:hypothetical protein
MSSATQLKISYDDFPILDVNPKESVDSSAEISFSSPTISQHLRKGRKVSDEYARNAKLAGRINASNISQEEHDSLLKERQDLLAKKFNGEITRKESNRLEYVRWSLDRIDDAKFGEAFDSLDAAVSRYEEFLREIRDLQSKLVAATVNQRQR